MVSNPKNYRPDAAGPQEAHDEEAVHPDEWMEAVRATIADDEAADSSEEVGHVVVGPFRGLPPGQAQQNTRDLAEQAFDPEVALELLRQIAGKADRSALPEAVRSRPPTPSRTPHPAEADWDLSSLPEVISDALAHAVSDAEYAELAKSPSAEHALAAAFTAAYSAQSTLRSAQRSGPVRKHMLSLGPVPHARDVQVFENLCAVVIYQLFYGNCPHFDGINEAASEYFRRALGSMESNQQKRTIVTLMALAGELQDEKLLAMVPAENLAVIGGLLAQAKKLAQPDSDSVRPPLFESRTRDPETLKRPSAMEWFDLHWRDRVARGEVFANDLKGIDLKLYQALATHQQRAGLTLADLLPIRFKRKAQMSPEEIAEHRQRVNERAAIRARRSRQAKPKAT